MDFEKRFKEQLEGLRKKTSVRHFWLSIYKVLNYTGNSIELRNLKIDLSDYFNNNWKRQNNMYLGDKQILFDYMSGYTQKELIIKYKKTQATISMFLKNHKSYVLQSI